MKIVFTDPYVKNLTAVGRYTDASTTGLNLNVKKNGGKYNFIIDDFTGKSLPDDQSFWNDLFANATKWGLKT